MFKVDCRDFNAKHQTLQLHDRISELIKFNICQLLHDQQNIGSDLNLLLCSEWQQLAIRLSRRITKSSNNTLVNTKQDAETNTKFNYLRNKSLRIRMVSLILWIC